MKVLLPSCVNVISVKKGIKFNSSHVPPTVHPHVIQRPVSHLFSTLSRTFEKKGHERDDWWFQFGDGESVGPVVS